LQVVQLAEQVRQLLYPSLYLPAAQITVGLQTPDNVFV